MGVLMSGEYQGLQSSPSSRDVILIYMSLDPTEVSNNAGQGDWTMYPWLEWECYTRSGYSQ